MFFISNYAYMIYYTFKEILRIIYVTRKCNFVLLMYFPDYMLHLYFVYVIVKYNIVLFMCSLGYVTVTYWFAGRYVFFCTLNFFFYFYFKHIDCCVIHIWVIAKFP